MSCPVYSNYKRSCHHCFGSCKQNLEAKNNCNSKSTKPPSTLRISCPTSLSNITVRHVMPFSIQSQQKNTIVVRGPLTSFSERTCARVKSLQNCKFFFADTKTNYSNLIFIFIASGNTRKSRGLSV